MNREARRIEQLLESLGQEKRIELEPTLKGKKGKDKIKVILEEKKRLEGGASSSTKKKGEDDSASRVKEKAGGKAKSKGKTEKSKRAAK